MEPIRVRVCVGTNCFFSGSESLIEMLESDTELADFVKIEGIRCMDKACAGGRDSPVVEIGDKRLLCATSEIVMEEIERLVVAGITGLPKSREVRDA
jgi:NADH:ubiquinone oxidoreductase subunit E